MVFYRQKYPRSYVSHPPPYSGVRSYRRAWDVAPPLHIRGRGGILPTAARVPPSPLVLLSLQAHAHYNGGEEIRKTPKILPPILAVLTALDLSSTISRQRGRERGLAGARRAPVAHRPYLA